MKRLIMAIIIAVSLLASSSCAMAGEKKKKEPISTSVIIPLKLKGLEWKLKYYQEKSLVAQLRSMIFTWNKQEFQETQKIIRETNKEIQHLLLLK